MRHILIISFLVLILSFSFTLSLQNDYKEKLKEKQVEINQKQEKINLLKEKNIEYEKEVIKMHDEIEKINEVINEYEKYIEFLKEVNIEKFEITAYAPFDNQSGICHDGNPNYTATGTRPQEGTFAVNPNVIPYHSNMIVIGDGGKNGDSWVQQGKALDTGGAMRQNPYLIDKYVDTYQQADNFGVQEGIVMYWGGD